MYNVAVKVAGESVNPYIFVFILTAVALIGHSIVLAVNKIFFNQELELSISAAGFGWAFMAGIGIILIELFYFLAVREGGLTISNAFWTVASLVIVIFIGLLFFNEAINATKAFGLALGALSLYLLTRS